MILNQVIRYSNATSIEATWVDEVGAVLRCHAYDATQLDELRTDLGADAPQYEALIQQCLADYVPPPPTPVRVPQEVTRAQGKAALITKGLWSQVKAFIAEIPNALERDLAEVALNDAPTWQRSSPFLNAAAAGLGLSAAELDQLFIDAEKIAL